jgi:hypothetical protein
MLEHRAQPAEKESQRNAQRHLRFPAYAFAKDDGNLTCAQCSAGAHHCLENNFETAGLRREFQQPGPTDGKETAHRIVQASERVRQRRSRSRDNPAPCWPAWRRSAFHVAAPDYKICCAGKQRRHQIFDPIRRMTQVCVHHEKNFSSCAPRTRHNRSC